MELVISASKFKATCLDILKRLDDHRLERVTVTRRGKPVAVMLPTPISEAEARSVYASMAGSVKIAEGVDLTEPAFEGAMDADAGILHR